MNLYPQDLGARRHVELIHARAHQEMGSTQPLPPLEKPPAPRIGLLGRLWTRGSGLTLDQAARALPASASGTTVHVYLWPLVWAFLTGVLSLAATLKGALAPEVAVLFPASTAGVAYLSALLAGHAFRTMHREPLKVSEVEALPTAHDDLERAYLALVVHVIRQSVPPDAQDEIRGALGALGDAIARLPAVPPVEDDSETLRHKADVLDAQAAADPDPVVAQSLQRQAESLRRRAETVRRSAQLGRRSFVVRQELREQVETLEAGIAAFNTGAGDVTSLSELAESVRQVATEADNLAAAREELDAACPALPEVAAPVRTASQEAAPLLQRIGRR